MEQYIIHETQNNLFFDPTTDERLQKIKAKLKQKYKNVEAMGKKVKEEVIKNKVAWSQNRALSTLNQHYHEKTYYQ